MGVGDLFDSNTFWFYDPVWFVGPADARRDFESLAIAMVKAQGPDGQVPVFFSAGDLADQFIDGIHGRGKLIRFSYTVPEDFGSLLKSLLRLGFSRYAIDPGARHAQQLSIHDLFQPE